MAPDISVVVPTYRRAAALRRTLAALGRQRGAPPFEVVVCDDGSPEGEAAAIADAVEAARTSAPGHGAAVRLVRQENAGPAAARNAGARAAVAPLLLFLDDDCAPAADLLARHWEAHQALLHPPTPSPHPAGSRRVPGSHGEKEQTRTSPLHPEGSRRTNGSQGESELVAVMGHVAWDPAMRVTPFMELVVRGAQFNYGAISDPEHVPFTCFYTANCSLARETLAAAGGFDASLPPFMEDTEFAYRLTKTGGRIVYRPDAVVYHEHAVELAPYLERQRKAGRAAVQVVQRHPELFDAVGVGDVADVALRETFYSALLRYAFVLGVEDGLLNQVRDGTLTGQELRGRFEEWVTLWGARQARQLRGLREKCAALEAELAQRDEQMAAVVQEKDAQIAALEEHLARLNALPPVALARTGKRLLARLRHNS
jgi:GT2 family glycosyltransferase